MKWDMIKRGLEISLFKTLRFNLHYFGKKGLKLPILISRHTKFHHLGGTIILDDNKFGSVFIGFKHISLFDVKYERSIWDNFGTVHFGKNIQLGQGTRISNGGLLEFGNQCKINANAMIICYKGIKFGEEDLISWDCTFMDTDFHHIVDGQGQVINEDCNIVIGNHVWIAANCTILKGTTIGNDCVIAAGTLLSGRKIKQSHAIITDHGKVLKSEINWHK